MVGPQMRCFKYNINNLFIQKDVSFRMFVIPNICLVSDANSVFTKLLWSIFSITVVDITVRHYVHIIFHTSITLDYLVDRFIKCEFDVSLDKLPTSPLFE